MPNPDHRYDGPGSREHGDDHRLKPVGMKDVWTVRAKESSEAPGRGEKGAGGSLVGMMSTG